MQKPIIIYKTDSGEIVGYGYIANPNLKSGEAFEECVADPSLYGKIRLGPNSYRTKTKQETDVEYDSSPQKRFDDLKKKNVLSLEEVTEVLKLRGLL